MRPSHEFTLELTAQELLDPPDLSAMAPTSDAQFTKIANELAPAPSLPMTDATSDLEIELTAEEIEALLEGSELASR
jgi:hypothetical protein